MSIFNLYPYINYNNQKATYILAKGEIISQYLNNYKTFYNYTIKDGERADIVAYKEYDDSSLDWIIYVINNVIDPYYDWYMTYDNFVSFLESKYNIAAYKLTGIPHHYYYAGLPSDSSDIIASYNYTMTPENYINLNRPAGWQSVSIWDYENKINEDKRDIKLLKPNYIDNFQQQFKNLFING
jgi:hypothetical protein